MKIVEKRGYDLEVEELYAILRLRQEVFVVEQNCVYQDLDNHDAHSIHILGFSDEKLIAYARILPPKELYPQLSIGRVLISKENRGKNLGRGLMQHTLSSCQTAFGNVEIKIMAQYYLVPFYQSFGFEIISEKFWEDEIAHFYMMRPARQRNQE
jgi:ElaA protein